jgi:hypothetical protein
MPRDEAAQPVSSFAGTQQATAEDLGDDKSQPGQPSTWSVWIQRGALAVAAGLAWWLFDKFDAPVWLVVLTLIVCLVSFISVRWLEKTERRKKGFVAFLIVYALAATITAITFSKPGEGTQTRPAPVSIPTPITSSSVTLQAQTSKDNQRILLDVKPEYLLGFFNKYSTAQAQELVKTYLGKWVKISVEVADVSRDEILGKDQGPSVMITTKIPGPDKDFLTHCGVEEQRWIDRALVLRRGERITVFGQITRIHERSFSLEKCEFVE